MKTMILLTALCCAALTGCVQEQKQMEFGIAYRNQLAAQTVNPEPAEATPVMGLDGQRAQEIFKAYRTPAQEQESATTLQDSDSNGSK
ncbi:hypothetical protein [Desulfocurvus sp. DL9XJH121]